MRANENCIRTKRSRQERRRTKDMQLLLLVVLALEATLSQAGSPCRRRGWLFCRGGSSPPPPNYDQTSFENGYTPPELPHDSPPHDSPPYPDDQDQSSYQTQHQSPPDLPQYQDNSMHSSDQNHAQYQQPPPLPPGYGDARFQGEMFQEPEANEGSEMIEPWGDTTNDQSGMDLTSFDKEYILKGLAKLYKKKILPLELSSRYGHFHSPPLSPADFVAPPMVLLLGQYRYVIEWRNLNKLSTVLRSDPIVQSFSNNYQCWKNLVY
jgi:hypothetical protein